MTIQKKRFATYWDPQKKGVSLILLSSCWGMPIVFEICRRWSKNPLKHHQHFKHKRSYDLVGDQPPPCCSLACHVAGKIVIHCSFTDHDSHSSAILDGEHRIVIITSY